MYVYMHVFIYEYTQVKLWVPGWHIQWFIASSSSSSESSSELQRRTRPRRSARARPAQPAFVQLAPRETRPRGNFTTAPKSFCCPGTCDFSFGSSSFCYFGAFFFSLSCCFRFVMFSWLIFRSLSLAPSSPKSSCGFLFPR